MSIQSILFGTMLHNYFKTTLRSMRKNPLSTFINIFGLAVAIGACMVTYAFVDFNLSIDRFHENKDEVFLTTYNVNREGTEERYGNAPAPLGKMLQADFSSIENMTRVHDGNAVIKYEDQVFHENIRYVDPSFLEMFTFPLKWGVASSLHDVNSIILNEEMAMKYFGDINPIGKEIKVIIGEGISKLFYISGVAKEFPLARIIDFSFLINIENMKILYPSIEFDDWEQQINATFIQVKDPSDLGTIQSKMGRYKDLQNEVEPDWPISSFGFVSVHDLHLASSEIRNDISYDASDEGRVSLPIVAGFILVLACFNYLNIAIVSAARRLKEIGMRKVIGANRGSIVFQFLSENLLMTFLAGMLGFNLAITVFLPWFASFANITSEFNLFDPNMWSFLIAVLLFTGIVSGIYPAFYISKFQAVKIFKGNLKFGQKNPATKVFLTIQLILTCVGIGFAVSFAQNSSYQRNRTWGYSQEEVVYAELQGSNNLENLKQNMLKKTGVISASSSQHHLSKSNKTTIAHLPDYQYEVKELAVDAHYFDVMDLKLKEGRFFQPNQESDRTSLVINEFFAKTLAVDNLVGQTLKIDSVQYRIIGIVNDFHFNNFYYEQRPTIFTLAPEEDHRFLSLKVADQAKPEVYRALQQEWAVLFPETPFNGGFQEDTWPEFYEELNIQQRFTRVIAIIFVLLAGLGLYGLIQLNIKGRVREFSIRKTLGAGIWNLTSNIARQYIVIFGIAILFGIPAAHFLNKAMLDMMYPDPRPFGYSGAIISAILLVLVLSLVIATQVRNVSKSNPVDGLKTE